MTAREETVLPPIDPSITDENDWWEFELTDVKVLRPGKMLYANVLDASDDNPVQVIGCLELKKNQAHLALDPDSTSNRIIIDDVTHYAYGQTEDRSVEIWVAGKAGWYLISPAKGYLPTFNRMVRAVDMLYFLIDRHKQGKKQINPTFKNLCRQYTFHTHGDCETWEQSAEAFTEHAPFLLRCMIEEDEYENVVWKQTNVFVHFRRQFPVSLSLFSADGSSFETNPCLRRTNTRRLWTSDHPKQTTMKTKKCLQFPLLDSIQLQFLNHKSTLFIS
jgi:hypothetical protein